MRVMLTGGSGFIGSHTAWALELAGHRPLIFDRNNHANADVFLGDIRDATAVHEAAAHADAIVHLAGVLGTQETIPNPRVAFETNVMGGVNILEAAARYDLPTVYIAVGNHWMDNPYSISKTTVERLCRMYRQEHKLTVSTVRAMNAYGPGQVPARPFGPSAVRKIMPAFVCRALLGEPIEIYGDGSQVMDLVHVTDVAKTLVAAIGENGDYDCGSGNPTTVKEIAQRIVDIVGDGELKFLPMRPGEPAGSVVLADKSRWLLTPSVNLLDGLVETVDWYKREWLPNY